MDRHAVRAAANLCERLRPQNPTLPKSPRARESERPRAGVAYFAYDARGRFSLDRREVDDSPYLLRQAYDAQDSVIRTTDPDGFE